MKIVQQYQYKQPRFYSNTTTNKKTKITYKCDDDYIEVPGGTESVTWTDEDGQSYEVDIGDLQEYDGEDGEIQYTKGRKNIPMILTHKRKGKKKPVAKPAKNAAPVTVNSFDFI